MKTVMSQVDAVCAAVQKVVGEINGPVKLEGEQRKQVHQILIQEFLDGNVALRTPMTKEQITKYVPSLVNNHLRKDKRLNGGQKYETKNPGSRAGAGDETMKALKNLLLITKDPKARAEVEAELELQKAKLAKPKVTIDPSKLPESLRHLVPANS